MTTKTILSMFLLILITNITFAQIPQTISYQGVLTDAQGNAVSDGSYSLTFKLYESATSGPLMWEETQGVTVANGIFNVVLGSSTVLNLPFNKQYWLGIAVDGGSELQPRIQLTASAYSLRARSLADSTATGATIADGSVVRSLNSLTEDVNLVAGDNVTVTNSANTVVISTTEARLSLPFGGRADEPGDVFSIINDGVGSVASFQIFNENGTAPVLDVVHRGLGFAGAFGVTKSDNRSPALTVLTKGLGPAIKVEHEGSAGNLAEFKTLAGNQVTFSRDGDITAAGDVEIGGKIVFADGTEQITAAFGAGQSWSLGGNANANPDTAFLGTVDNQPFEIKVNNSRGFRLEFASSGQTFSPNVIGGVAGNRVINAIGATISGGGVGFSSHSISADFGTIGGGTNNEVSARFGTVSGGEFNRANSDHTTVGGGENNSANFSYDTVSGGKNNVARGDESGFVTVGGGFFNQALSDYATVAGGQENTASSGTSSIGGGRKNLASGQHSAITGGNQNHATSRLAAIGGGESNVASGTAATVPGGDRNEARGGYSFAAGYKARAIHEGSFVWNDRSVTNFNDSLVTTAANQFLVRAAGGVGIGTNSPSFPLEMGSGAHVTAGGVWTNASSRAYKENIIDLSAEEAISTLQNLNPVKYRYKKETDEEYVGFIAEEVPELVATKDRKSLSPMDIVGVLTKVVQEQRKAISKLQDEVNALKQQIK